MKRILGFFKNSILILWRRHHFIVLPKYWGRYFKFFIRKISGKTEVYLNPFVIKEYNKWLEEKNKNIEIKKFDYNPLISFIIPVYNIEPIYLKDCIDSILNQSYQNFEICIADDCSTNKDTIKTLKLFEKQDKRIRVVYRKINGHISESTNSALAITKGEYIALMDDDDTLDKNALYKVVEALNFDRKIDFIYSDEDKLDMNGNYCEPHFKTDFAVDSLFGGNYICHFTVIKKTIFNKIGNFDKKYVGAQDFDLFLRATEVADKIYHIPEILYHWRKIPGSTADTVENKDYAIENGRKAVETALKRRKIDGYVTAPIKCTHYVVNYNVKNNPKLSIVMLDVNKKIFKNNIAEFLKINKYENIEFVVNCNSLRKEKEYKNIIFNSSSDINELINLTSGEYILITVGKIKLDSGNLLETMIGYASQKNIGVVGPKIYHFSKTIKSAGLILSNECIYSNAFHDYFTDSLGYYGRLLVPYNYSAISNRFTMFEKKKYLKVDGYLNCKNFDISNIDFCLKMLSNGYRNILISNRHVKQKDLNSKKYYEMNIKESRKILNKWDLDSNKYYNKNLSKKYPFMLSVGDKNEKRQDN